jgi:hypothetical protein
MHTEATPATPSDAGFQAYMLKILVEALVIAIVKQIRLVVKLYIVDLRLYVILLVERQQVMPEICETATTNEMCVILYVNGDMW